MNEVIVNPNEIESVWEKDKLCFVKMNSGKVWLCEEFIKIGNDIKFPTKKFKIPIRFLSLLKNRAY